jgi:hypothetical protein
MLNIARQIYAGWDTIPTAADTLPEAEVIPNGDAPNEKKKIAKFTTNHKVVKEFDNIPLPGFTLHKTNRAKWGSVDPTWLIIDPRGFLARISQDNLEKILHVTGITEGLIQEQCVWARENTNTKLTLVPISSPSYIEAVRNTELIEGKVDMSEVQIGDTVLLQNKLQGIYLGVMSLYAGLHNASSRTELKVRTYLRRQVVQTDTDKFHFQSDVKILKVVNRTSTPMTREDSMKIMNDSIAGGNSYFSSDSQMNSARYFSRDIVRFASVHAVQTVNLSLEEVDELGATALFYDGQAISDSGLLVLEKANGDRFLIDHPWAFTSGPINSVHGFNTLELSSKEWPEDKLVLREEKRYYSQPKGQTFKLDNFVKFYKIVKHVKKDSYV